MTCCALLSFRRPSSPLARPRPFALLVSRVSSWNQVVRTYFCRCSKWSHDQHKKKEGTALQFSRCSTHSKRLADVAAGGRINRDTGVQQVLLRAYCCACLLWAMAMTLFLEGHSPYAYNNSSTAVRAYKLLVSASCAQLTWYYPRHERRIYAAEKMIRISQQQHHQSVLLFCGCSIVSNMIYTR